MDPNPTPALTGRETMMMGSHPRRQRVGFSSANPFCPGLWRASPRLALWCEETRLQLLGELGDYQGMGLTEEVFKFGAGQCGFSFHGYPVGPGQVGGGHDSLALDQLGEVFVAAFEGEAHPHGLQRGDRKHFATYLEDEIVIPLDLLGDAWERKQKCAQTIDVHSDSVMQETRIVETVGSSDLARDAPDQDDAPLTAFYSVLRGRLLLLQDLPRNPRRTG